METFRPSATKVWRKGEGIGALYLMRRLAVGESLLLADRKSVHASATVGRYRMTYEPDSQWTTRTVSGGVVLIRLADLAPDVLAAKKAHGRMLKETRDAAPEARGGVTKRKSKAGRYALAVADMDFALVAEPDDAGDLFD